MAAAASSSGGADESVCVLSGHSDWVRTLVLLPSGDGLASGSEDKTIKLWALEEGKCTHTLHTEREVWVLSPLPGELLAAGGSGGVDLWSLRTGSYVCHFEHPFTVFALAPLPSGCLASGQGDRTGHEGDIRLWHVETGEHLRTLTHGTGTGCPVFALVQLPDDRLASGGTDKAVKIWVLKTGECSHTLTGHNSSVRALAPLPGGLLASGSGDHLEGSSDNSILLWATEAWPEEGIEVGSCVWTFTGHTDVILALAPLPDGLLASASSDETIKIWATATGKCKRTLRGHSDGVRALVPLPNGTLASASFDMTIRLWNADADAGAAARDSHAKRRRSPPARSSAAGSSGAAGISGMEGEEPESPTAGGGSRSIGSSTFLRGVSIDGGSVLDGERTHLMLSGRFKDNTRKAYIAELRALLEARHVPVFIVEASGDALADQTMQGLNHMKAMCAVCHADYGAKGRGGHGTYKELRYAHQKDIPILALQLCDEWPPQPSDEAGRSQNDSVLAGSLVHIDGRSKAMDAVATELADAWEGVLNHRAASDVIEGSRPSRSCGVGFLARCCGN